MSIRRYVWLKLIEAAPFIPRGPRGTALRYRIIERTRLAPLQLSIARGDTVVQVGAVGNGEIWEMARLVGPKGHVVALEPAPDNVEAILQRVKDKRVENVTVIPMGAWSAHGTQTLHLVPESPGSHIVLGSGSLHDRAKRPEEYEGALQIDVDRLDEILPAHGIPWCDFIKITVMGAEMQVLAGMERLLQSTPKLWVKAHALVDGAPANRAVARLLNERGYRTVIVRGNQGPGGRERPGDVYATRL